MKRGLFKVFSCTIVIALIFLLTPGNVSGQPLDLSGIGNGISRLVNNIQRCIPDFDISISENNPAGEEKVSFEKVVVQVDPDKDAEIKSPDEKITVKIPRGAVEKQAEIEFIQYAPSGSSGMVMLKQFELNAKELETGISFSEFRESLEIIIKHEPAELAGVDINSIRLYYLDEKTGQWVPVETGAYDPKENTITAKVDHFTYYGEQANPLQVGPGRIMAAQVNLSSGAATFSYPLELPPGPGGFRPKLELHYNSGSVDEMKNKQAVAS